MADSPDIPDAVRYPIGRFHPLDRLDPGERIVRIETIEAAPARLREAVVGLSDHDLERTYRDGGWSIRQVVHHVADSHVNGYVRFRWMLTEPEPTIKAYDQPRWAELPDACSAPLDHSLDLLDTLHRRWVELLKAMKPEDWARSLVKPDGGRLTGDGLVQLYAWHGRHHTAHISRWRERSGL